MRPFRAPDRPIAIPDGNGRASEGLAGRNGRGEQEQAEHRPVRNADDSPIQTLQISQRIKGQREAPE